MPKTGEVEEALQYLLVGEGKGRDYREETLMEWYTNEARLHFAKHVRPLLETKWEKVHPLIRLGLLDRLLMK